MLDFLSVASVKSSKIFSSFSSSSGAKRFMFLSISVGYRFDCFRGFFVTAWEVNVEGGVSSTSFSSELHETNRIFYEVRRHGM
jgi:hypothetical protein